MKDKDRLERAEYDIRELIKRTAFMIKDGLDIKDCPKCKHPVMVQEKLTGKSFNQQFGVSTYESSYYLCLTCGSKFTCSEKCVCELIDDKKGS